MNIGNILKTVGVSALKNNPLGAIVYDIADAVLDDDIPSNITGDEMNTLLSKLPPEQYVRIAEKKIDAGVKKRQMWADVQMSNNSNPSRVREIGVLIMISVLGILCILFALMLGNNYITTGVLPSLEITAIVFGIPAILIAGFFGISTEKVVDFVISSSIRRMGIK